MTTEKKLNRRDFLKASAMTAVGVLAASCAQPTPVVIEKEVPVEKIVKETVVVEKEVPVEKVVKETVIVEKQVPVERVVTATPLPAKFHEAPSLAALVKQGKLPPVEERLPLEPMVVQPHERIGKYGGDWNLGGVRAGAFMNRCTEYENVFRWTWDWSAIIPNVIKDFQIANDGKTFIFDLRKGMKWSDGHPLTADDFTWRYEEMLNKELYPAFPAQWKSGGEPCVVTKIDDYTVKFDFVAPYGLFFQQLCMPGSYSVFTPKHFNQQFFPGYADQATLNKKIKEAGVTFWYEAWSMWTSPQMNSDRPVIYPWMYTKGFDGSSPFIAVRNPYYWKVDPEGNQLPYIDRQVYTIAQDNQVLVMKVIAGELDFQDLYIGGVDNKALYAENADKANLRFIETRSASASAFPVGLNLTHKDPAKRQLFQNKDFRIALSHAINREEINQVIFAGQAQPAQISPLPGSPFYDEEMEKQYLEYDPDKANRILDGIIPNRDKEGFRLGLDGKELGILMTVTSSYQTYIDSFEMIKNYWAAVGIRSAVKATENSLINEMLPANEPDLTSVYGVPGGSLDIFMEPRAYLPMHNHTMWAPLWTNWYLSGGQEGEEPIPPVKKQLELYRELLQTVDSAKQFELMREILKIAKENFWEMGIVRPTPGYAICKRNFRNVPEWYWASWSYPNPGPTNPEQYFWDV